MDDRINVIIDLDNEIEAFDNQPQKDFIYEVKINRYPIAQLNAKGSIIRTLGLNSGVEGDIEILLSKNNIYPNMDILLQTYLANYHDFLQSCAFLRILPFLTLYQTNQDQH